MLKSHMLKHLLWYLNDYVGSVMELCQRKRGNFITMDYLASSRVNIIYELPLAEIVFDFFDQLKSNTKGYASFDYELIGYKQSKLVKMDILLNGEQVMHLALLFIMIFLMSAEKQLLKN